VIIALADVVVVCAISGV